MPRCRGTEAPRSSFKPKALGARPGLAPWPSSANPAGKVLMILQNHQNASKIYLLCTSKPWWSFVSVWYCCWIKIGWFLAATKHWCLQFNRLQMKYPYKRAQPPSANNMQCQTSSLGLLSILLLAADWTTFCFALTFAVCQDYDLLRLWIKWLTSFTCTNEGVYLQNATSHLQSSQTSRLPCTALASCDLADKHSATLTNTVIGQSTAIHKSCIILWNYNSLKL